MGVYTTVPPPPHWSPPQASNRATGAPGSAQGSSDPPFSSTVGSTSQMAASDPTQQVDATPQEGWRLAPRSRAPPLVKDSQRVRVPSLSHFSATGNNLWSALPKGKKAWSAPPQPNSGSHKARGSEKSKQGTIGTPTISNCVGPTGYPSSFCVKEAQGDPTLLCRSDDQDTPVFSAKQGQKTPTSSPREGSKVNLPSAIHTPSPREVRGSKAETAQKIKGMD